MGFRFHRSFKLAPGIRMTVTPKGLGVSAGSGGAKLSVHSSGRVTGTAGIPGSGLSYTQRRLVHGHGLSEAHSQDTRSPGRAQCSSSSAAARAGHAGAEMGEAAVRKSPSTGQTSRLCPRSLGSTFAPTKSSPSWKRSMSYCQEMILCRRGKSLNGYGKRDMTRPSTPLYGSTFRISLCH